MDLCARKFFFKIKKFKTKNAAIRAKAKFFIVDQSDQYNLAASAKLYILEGLFEKSEKDRVRQLEDCSYSCSEINDILFNNPEAPVSEVKYKSMVFIDELVVEPSLQNQSVGSDILSFLSKKFSSDIQLVALEACPVGKLDEYTNIENVSERKIKMRTDIDRLRKWYGSFGFLPMEGTDYMLLAKKKVG